MAALALSGSALANSNSWAFEMNFRYVNGSDNGQLHYMTAGSLTNTGQIWAYSRDGGYTSSPTSVNIRVYKTMFFGDTLMCTKTITPSSNVGTKKSWGPQNCGSAQADDYYIQADKSVDDGWNIKADGTLRTS